MGKLHDRNPSDFNVNDYRYLTPVAKLPSVPEHRNAPDHKPSGTARSLFPPLFHAGRDSRVG
jgi:hypothetical protein